MNDKMRADVKVGFSEKYEHLQRDPELWLEGISTVEFVVLFG